MFVAGFIGSPPMNFVPGPRAATAPCTLPFVSFELPEELRRAVGDREWVDGRHPPGALRGRRPARRRQGHRRRGVRRHDRRRRVARQRAVRLHPVRAARRQGRGARGHRGGPRRRGHAAPDRRRPRPGQPHRRRHHGPRSGSTPGASTCSTPCPARTWPCRSRRPPESAGPAVPALEVRLRVASPELLSLPWRAAAGRVGPDRRRLPRHPGRARAATSCASSRPTVGSGR